MPGVFSKSVGWIVATVKNVSKIANIGKRGVLFVWIFKTALAIARAVFWKPGCVYVCVYMCMSLILRYV